MPLPLHVLAMATIGPFGNSPESLAAAWGNPVPPLQRVPLSLGGGGEVAALLADQRAVEQLYPPRQLRRLDSLNRLALYAARAALQAGGCVDGAHTGLIVATGYGALRTGFAYQDSLLCDGDTCVSPTHFSQMLHHTPAANIAIFNQLFGPTITVSQFEMSLFSALQTAQTWLGQGRVKRVLLGCVDEYCDALGYFYHRLFEEEAETVQPFSLSRQTAVPGEGASFFLISADSGEIDRPGAVLARISSVQCGHPASLPFAALNGETSRPDQIFCGLDGHRCRVADYQHWLEKTATPLLSGAPLYGSLPTAAGFDLVLACLAASSTPPPEAISPCRRGEKPHPIGPTSGIAYLSPRNQAGYIRVDPGF